MNFLKKIFGGGKDKASEAEVLVEDVLAGLIEKGGFDLDFQIEAKTDDRGEPQLLIELSGADEEILRDREGQMIESIQLFLKRVLQHNLPEDRTHIVIDSNGFREESSQALVELAEKLKGIALEKGKPVYFRALAPKDRKVIHQHLANDQRIRSRSIGEGLFKKIKIYPIKAGSVEDNSADME